MARNISRLRPARFNSLSAPPDGSSFHIPIELARLVAREIYGSHFVELNADQIHELLESAYQDNLFSYQIKIL